MADGFTTIGNDLFDAVLRSPLHHREKTVCFTLLRLTLGYGRQALRVIFTEEIAAAANLEERELRRVLSQLQRLGVVRREARGPRRAAFGVAEPSEWRIDPGAGPPGESVDPGAGHQGALPLIAGAEPPGNPGAGPPPLISEKRETKEDIQNDGASAVVVREVASLEDQDLITAAEPGFVAYGKRVERWGEARKDKLRERAGELVRSGLSRERALAAISAAPHGFLWFHRRADPQRFDPWRLFTPDTVYGEGFDRYLEAYGEARRAGMTPPFTTRHAKPAGAAVVHKRTAAAPAPAERAPNALERAQVEALTALRHRLRRFPTDLEVEAERARVAAAWETRACVA